MITLNRTFTNDGPKLTTRITDKSCCWPSPHAMLDPLCNTIQSVSKSMGQLKALFFFMLHNIVNEKRGSKIFMCQVQTGKCAKILSVIAGT